MSGSGEEMLSLDKHDELTDGLENGVNITEKDRERCKESNGEANTDMQGAGEIMYKVYETPPLHLTVLFGLQHYMSIFLSSITAPFLISQAICMGEDNVGKAEIIGTLFTASGLITLVQNLFGCRLPIIQSATFAIMLPTLSYFQLEKWKCPSNIVSAEDYMNLSLTSNASDYIITGSPEHREVWMIRLREVQGAIMCASLLEVFLGLSGAVGLLLRYIGPLTICPTITLLGLGLFKGAASYGEKHWPICIATMLLIVIFSQYIGHLQIPCVAYTTSKGVHKQSYPIFKMFPFMLAMGIMWLLCFVLTVTGAFSREKGSTNYWARTDIRSDAITSLPWFRIPYPFQWGMPTVSIAAVCAILSGVLTTTVESIGDYHACAKLSAVPPPPLHAVNRGIFVEGLGSFFDGIIGTGNGTTSASTNVGIIGITSVASRMVIIVCALLMFGLGIFTKFSGVFVSMPDPIIGACFYILFGMIVAVGISNVQYVNLNSARNLFIIGFSIFNGLSIPIWVANNHEAIRTGNDTLDNILIVLLSTSMVTGGLSGFILDNAIRGTPEERGIAQWQKTRDAAGELVTNPSLYREIQRVYDLPFGMSFFKKHRWTSRIPISPTYGMPKHDSNVENNVI